MPYTIYTVENSVLQSCSYIVHDGRNALLIDCGDVHKILDYISKHNLELKYVLLTHCHYDHIYGLNTLLSVCTDAKVYCHHLGKENINNRKYNLYFTLCPDTDYQFLYEDRLYSFTTNTFIEISGHRVKLLETIGHTADSVSYLFDNNLFTGDAYNPNYKLSSAWPNSVRALAMQSEAFLKDLIKNNNYNLYPGHWM